MIDLPLKSLRPGAHKRGPGGGGVSKRDELLARGIVLKDTKEGTTWEVAR